MANINKIRISGSTFDIEDKNAAKTVTLTQAEYDALTVKDPNVFYVISDSEYNFDGYWTSAQTQSAITQSVSGKADTSAVTSVSDSLTAHTANTTVHVTAQDKTNWNAKSDFSGNYNDLSNKPTIPSKTSDLTNDSDFATTGDVQTATSDMATKTWVGQQGYLTQHQDISGKQDVSGMTAYTTTATTSALNDVVTAHTANTSIHVSAEQIAAWNAKSDFSGSYNDLTNKLSAGTNVSIVDNVISAEGGGSITIDPSLDSGSTNAVANSAITTALNDTVKLSNLSTYYINGFTNYVNRTIPIFHRFDINNQSNGNAWWFGKINDKYVITTGQTSVTPSDLMNLQVVETSAITTSITSSSTDSQVPSAKAVYSIIPTSNTAFTNDAGYLVANDISGKTDTSAFTAHTADTTIHVTAQDKATWNAKSDFSGDYNDLTNKLSAGTNITIVDNVISAEGGSSITIDPSLDASSTNPVANSAITTAIDAKASKNEAVGSYQFGATSNVDCINFKKVNTAQSLSSIYYPKINGKGILTSNYNWAKNNYDFQLLETSAITTSVTSSSTDSQIPSAKAVNDKLGGLSIVKMTQSEYDALATKDSNTLYVING